jgi:hypothetical protein
MRDRSLADSPNVSALRQRANRRIQRGQFDHLFN